jgi:hypothetical protein
MKIVELLSPSWARTKIVFTLCETLSTAFSFVMKRAHARSYLNPQTLVAGTPNCRFPFPVPPPIRRVSESLLPTPTTVFSALFISAADTSYRMSLLNVDRRLPIYSFATNNSPRKDATVKKFR